MNKKSFTIIELLVVVLISAVAFAGLYSTFLVGNTSWTYYNTSIAVKKEARRALFGMAKELREAEKIKVIHSANGIILYFYRPSVGNVSYAWSKEGDDAYRIIRHNQLNTRIIAQYISALSFEPSHNRIIVNITAGKQTTGENTNEITLTEKIALRSKTVKFTQ